MAYLSDLELAAMNFKSIGKNVKISSCANIYNPESIEINDYSRIDDFCVLSGKIKIGKYIHIAPFCLLAGGVKGIVMEDFSGLAYGAKVFTQSDDYSGESLTNPTVDKKFKNETFAEVRIGRHVIVGTGSIIFPGVNIAEGCSVGAMALVNRSTEPWGIYLGNPARRIKSRSRKLLELEKQFLSETQG
ncbi:MAG: O-acetyltransferase [Candidatus Wallbacteria bacterium HGW-Wallbacteria-1]|jgi:acetyltransferase-like isoleucine patch superfamily enzyme|uniref:O-acetyltransferase n=1 Tax=Candidatus Wallbacteria bacterium HGW-Wallbacteria-1 TaxID=2013854 RepID=A0A2N1PM67_9BACT|nr:MAG: O-acetyltransferase [Candidatus Wallbacteria bacterium HGW-Wallbacteria-1]